MAPSNQRIRSAGEFYYFCQKNPDHPFECEPDGHVIEISFSGGTADTSILDKRGGQRTHQFRTHVATVGHPAFLPDQRLPERFYLTISHLDKRGEMDGHVPALSRYELERDQRNSVRQDQRRPQHAVVSWREGPVYPVFLPGGFWLPKRPCSVTPHFQQSRRCVAVHCFYVQRQTRRLNWVGEADGVAGLVIVGLMEDALLLVIAKDVRPNAKR